MAFSPQPKSIDYPVEDRFAEFATPLLGQFDSHAAVIWISFGPATDDTSLQWGGSVWAVLQSSSPEDLRSPMLNSAIEKLYAIFNAAFHRTIVDSGHREEASRRLELTYFAFGHDLKNRLGSLGLVELRNRLRDSAPNLSTRSR